MSNDFEAVDALRDKLARDERVLWRGRPKQGLIFGLVDLWVTPFSMVWTGVFIYGFGSELGSGSLLSLLFFLPFFVIGLYMVAGRFWVDSRSRARTFYAVTDQRIIFVSGAKRSITKSLPLRTLTDISIVEKGDGSGTVTFGAENPWAKMHGSGLNFGVQTVPTFLLANGAREVYEIIRQAQIDELKAHMRA